MQRLIPIVAVLVFFSQPASAQQTIIGERLRIAQESDLSGEVGHPDYISQLTRWKITAEGGADFRYLFTDELHAKSFIADLEQALAGAQIISKSVAVLASNFIVPAAGAAATITVRDLPSAENMAVFESGDTIRLRSFSRASGSLTIADAYGVVTAYADQTGGVQTWTFTRNSGADAGTMTASTVIQADAIVLDYGVSGNGFHEVNAIDGLYGVNSPYSQVVTWATSPIGANLTVRSRLGNLRGITGNTGEYGLIAGSYAATNGQYFRASNNAFELHGIDLSLWDGATRTFYLNRSTPSFAMGSSAPSAYGTGVGCWQGKDAGVYKWRCGNPAGDRIEWNGTTLNVVGNVTVTGAGGYVPTGGAAADVVSGVATPSGSGLFLGSDKMGYYASGAWQTYMDNAGNFYLGGTSGSLQWNGSTLSISGSVTATSGTIGGWTIGGSTLTGGVTTLNSNGNVTVGSGNNVARLSDDATYRLWVGHATASSAPFRVTVGGGVTMSSVDITGGTLDIGPVEITSTGIVVDSGTGSNAGYRFAGGYRMTHDSIEGQIQFTAGSASFEMDSDGFFIAGGLDIGSDGIDVGGNIRASTSGLNIGTSGSRFNHIFLAGDINVTGFPTTTDADYPVVYSTTNTLLYRKTNGVTGTTCAGLGIDSINWDRGIAVSVTCN